MVSEPRRVGEVVHELRDKLCLSLRELSNLTKMKSESGRGISAIQISRIERLETNTTEKNIVLLAQALDVSIGTLFGEEAYIGSRVETAESSPSSNIELQIGGVTITISS